MRIAGTENCRHITSELEKPWVSPSSPRSHVLAMFERGLCGGQVHLDHVSILLKIHALTGVVGQAVCPSGCVSMDTLPQDCMKDKCSRQLVGSPSSCACQEPGTREPMSDTGAKLPSLN